MQSLSTDDDHIETSKVNDVLRSWNFVFRSCRCSIALGDQLVKRCGCRLLSSCYNWRAQATWSVLLTFQICFARSLQSSTRSLVWNNTKMPKRKRDGGDGEDTEGRNGVKQRRIEHKLKLGATKLGHAFKVAKGFERQKLGRRRKNAVSESNVKDVARIDSEIEALKVC
jgi:hypothetical protein